MTRDIAKLVLNNSKDEQWTKEIQGQQTLGIIKAPVECNNWSHHAKLVVAEIGLRPFIGRDLFSALGIPTKKTAVSRIFCRSTCPLKQQIEKKEFHGFSTKKENLKIIE